MRYLFKYVHKCELLSFSYKIFYSLIGCSSTFEAISSMCKGKKQWKIPSDVSDIPSKMFLNWEMHFLEVMYHFNGVQILPLNVLFWS